MYLGTNSERNFKQFCSSKCKKNPAAIIIICCLNKYYNFMRKKLKCIRFS